MAREKKNEPWVSNYPPLKVWLDKHEALCNWQLLMGNPGEPRAYVESWRVGKSEVIIIVRADRMGWDIFTPCNSNLIDKTLKDAEKRCGL